MSGFFKSLFGPQPDESERRFEVTLSVDGAIYPSTSPAARDNPAIEHRLGEHLRKILGFYREYSKVYADNQNIKTVLIKKINPNAHQSTCPYCGTVHEFKASRARQCPDCREKMVVRGGVYLKEEEADKLQKLEAAYYQKTSELTKLAGTIQNAQDLKNSRRYVGSCLAVADAYQSCALIHNKSYENGFTARDFSWGMLNEVLEVMAATSEDPADIRTNGYTDVLFARGMHSMRELKVASKDKAKIKYAKLAIGCFYDYLFELYANGLEDWHIDDALKMIHVALALGGLGGQELASIESATLSEKSGRDASKARQRAAEQVEGYILAEIDPERLKWMIY